MERKNIPFYLTIGFVILAGIYFRLDLYCHNLSFFHDEALLALNLYDLKYSDFFHSIHNVQIAPALFMVISKFLLNISNTSNDIWARDLILRLFPMITSLIVLIIFPFFVQKIFKNNYTTIASTAILCFNTPAINYSQEFKQYSSDLLICLILAFIFIKLDFKKESPLKLGLYSILFSGCMWFSYPSCFILAAGFLYIIFDIIKNKLFDFKKIIGLFLPLGICSITFLSHLKEVSDKYFELMQWHWTYIERSFLTFDNFIYMFPYKTGSLFNLNEYLIILLLIIGTVILITKNSSKISFHIIAPIVLCIIASLIKRYPYEQRLILFLLPLFAIILSQIFAFKKTKISNFIIYTFISIITIYQFFIPYEKRDINYSHAREYTQILIDNNIKEENLLAMSSVSKYYLMPHFKKRITVYNDLWKGFNKDSFKEALDKLPPNQTLWLLAPREMPDFYEDSMTQARKYLEENHQYKIEEIIQTKKDKSYLIKFIKKSNL